MTSHNPEPPVPLASALPGAVQRLPLLERVSRYRQPIGLAVTLVLFTMALIACRHLLSELDIYALHDAMLSVPAQSVLGALLATVIGFVILLGYEWSASRYAGVKLPARSLVLGGFSAFAIGNAIGLSMLSGGSVRYRLYARQGLGAGEVARMTVFASLSLGCALPPRRLGNLERPAGSLDRTGVGAWPAGRYRRRRAGGVRPAGVRPVPPALGRTTAGQ